MARSVAQHSDEARAAAVLDEISRDARRLVTRGLTLAPAPADRAWLRLVEGLDVDAWLIVWSRGAATGMHDHGDSQGIVRVLRGSLLERYAAPGRTRERERRLRAGTTTFFGHGHRHDVRNAGRDEAVSLHVYAPALTRMQFYSEAPPASEPSLSRKAFPVRL
jgi:predicted metal-dependent enzyme (double-stranded beta helix superfamily)